MQVFKRIKSIGCGVYRSFSRAVSPITNMDGLELNKLAAAILVAGLIALVAGKVATILYRGEEEAPEGKRSYSIAGADTGDAGGTPVADEKPVMIALFLPKGDKAKGEATAKACTTCHDFSKGGPNKVGPNLYGIVGAKHAHKEDYTYSKAIAGLPGNWDYQSLSEFITKPAKYAPGTKMGFAGLKDPQDRANVLAYLQTLSDSPVAFPPAPAAGADEKAAAPAKSGKETAPASKGKDAKDAPTETRSGDKAAAEPGKKPEDAAAEAKSKGVPTPNANGPTSAEKTPAPNAATKQSTEGKTKPTGAPTKPADNSDEGAKAAAKPEKSNATPENPVGAATSKE